MYCNQCEQTARGVACTIQGVCGKNSEVAALQDLLIHSLKGLSIVALHARKCGIIEDAVDQFVVKFQFFLNTTPEAGRQSTRRRRNG